METGKWLPPHCWETAPKSQLEKEGCLDNRGELRLQGRGQGNTAARESLAGRLLTSLQACSALLAATNKIHLFCLPSSRPWLSPPL